MRFPPQFIDKLRNHSLISEVIGRRMQLKRHGREYQGLCPFHKEKSPSFTVNDEKGFYHCFGCAAHGDAIRFVQEFDKLNYPEAIERLAGECGLPLPERSHYDEVQEKKITTLYDVMEHANQWFKAQLGTSQGEVARRYLRERGISDETVSQFHIGFAPASRDGLKQALLKMGISDGLMKDAGLIIVPDNGGAAYDRFRARLMFPIRDMRGKVIAFGGRILPALVQGDQPGAKYLNSPETELFKKGEVLYNLDRAKVAAREAGQLVAVEGYMDVIALAQAGIGYAVAPLGTALTASHIKLMWRTAREPVLCFDGDAAGGRAMERAAEQALPLLVPGCSLNFAVLPASEDPDTLIRTQGVKAMLDILSAANPLSETMFDLCQRREGADTPEKQAALEMKLMQVSEGISNATVKNYYRQFFRQKLWEMQRGKPAAKKEAARPALLLPEASEQQELARLERELMRLVVRQPVLLQLADVEEIFARIVFSRSEFAQMQQHILGAAQSGGVLADILAKAGFAQQMEILLKQSAADPSDDASMHHLWKQMSARYELAKMQAEYREIASELAHSMSEGGLVRLTELQKQIEKAEKINRLEEEESWNDASGASS
jgi:DNA primase